MPVSALSMLFIARVATLSLYSRGNVCPFQSFLCQLSRSRTHGACDGEFAVRLPRPLFGIAYTHHLLIKDEEAGQGGWFWNEQVGSFRPPGALYCRECGVLVQDYDHL